MKRVVLNISFCRQCPHVDYIHYDGEGTSAPYQYNTQMCKITNAPQEERERRTMPWQKHTPENLSRRIYDTSSIPDWCPLENM